MFSDRNQSKAGSSVHLDYIGWTQADACTSIILSVTEH